jgi:hypothetical protein
LFNYCLIYCLFYLFPSRFIEIIANLNESEMRLLKALNEHRSPGNASVSGLSTPFGLERAENE